MQHIVIEVDPFAFDSVFYTNYNHQLEFAEYIISTGHTTPGKYINGERAGLNCPFQTYDSFAKLGCKKKPLEQNVFKGQSVRLTIISKIYYNYIVSSLIFYSILFLSILWSFECFLFSKKNKKKQQQQQRHYLFLFSLSKMNEQNIKLYTQDTQEKWSKFG